MTKSSKKFLTIVLAVALVLGSLTVYASSRKVNLEVMYDNIKLNVNGENVAFGKDLSGEQIEPFIHKGVTYLPVRAVGEALGKDVKWDGDTKTVLISDSKDNDAQGQYLTEILKPFDSTSVNRVWTTKPSDKTTKKLGGVEYNDMLQLDTYYEREMFVSYNLEGKYSELTGKVGLDSEGAINQVKFYGDNRLLKEFDITGGQLPTDFSVDVKGVNHLKILVITNNKMVGRTGFVDLIIK